jgi:hypothetical protein
MQDTKARINRDVTFREFIDLARTEDPRILQLSTGDASRVLAYSRYAEYVPPWLESFPKTNLHFLLFEDLRRDPATVAKTVSAWLGIEPAFYESYDFRTKNKSFRIRNARLHQVKRGVGRHIPVRARRRLKSAIAPAYRLNVDSAPVPVTDDELNVMEELERSFAPLNDQLAALTGLDLTAWR